MNFIYLYGPMAVGKLSVAQELSQRTQYKLFDNHKTVDMVLSLFDFGTPEFLQLIRDVRFSALESAARSDLEGVIFTHAFSAPADDLPGYSPGEFAQQVAGIVTAFGGNVYPVQLTAPKESLYERINHPFRRKRKKMTNRKWLKSRLEARDYFARAPLAPLNHPTIDTYKFSIEQTATQIITHYNLPDLFSKTS